MEVTAFDGPCPAGNVGVQVNHISPVNKGEVVWTVEPTAVLFIGRLMLGGKVDLRRTVAFAGSVLYMAPILILYGLFDEELTQGLSAARL